jgi:hypothetical protein
MLRRKGFVVYALCYLLFCGLAFAGFSVGLDGVAFGAPANDGDRLEEVTVTIKPDQLPVILSAGFEIGGRRAFADRIELDVVIWGFQKAKLEAIGATVVPKERPGGVQRQQAGQPYQVWKSFDEAGGFKDRNYEIANKYPDLVKLVEIGKSIQGRPIIALKVTENAKSVRDNSRPAVLFQSMQHAREWISPETNYRLLKYMLEQHASGNQEIRELLRTREVWFVLVINPDGYQYTFTNERLWRKNLRDNNGDGQIGPGDGVDLNRNWPGEKWGYDNEGSSPDRFSETYRGTGPASEPETKALVDLQNRIDFKFMIDYHSVVPVILYPIGFQIDTESFDRPIYEALAGTGQPGNQAVEGYPAGEGASALYITNGDVTDYAYTEQGVLAYTVELGEGEEGAGFEFPDNEALVQAEFEKNIQFALDLVRSADDPTSPDSHLGNTVKPFYIDAFEESRGSPQEVRGTVLRKLGRPVVFKYQINNQPVRTRPAWIATLGERVGDVGDEYYKGIRGVVQGADPGDKVRVWFEAKNGTKSDEFTYTVSQDTNNPVLVIANEDYTGLSPAQTSGPTYLKTYTDALDAARIKYDTYDVDAEGRQAPHPLGILKHYRVVIWETGDDIITREPGMGPGQVSRLANDMIVAVRTYIENGGKVIYVGKYAGLQQSNAYVYNPTTNAPAEVGCDNQEDPLNCRLLQDDFLQYYLGAYIYNSDAGTTEEGGIYPADGSASPLQGLGWTFEPQVTFAPTHTASFIATSYFLPNDEFPQFGNPRVAANFTRPGAPFEPLTGDKYVYSNIADATYKRLTRTIDLRGQSSGKLEFYTSYDIELDWDYLFVEARTAGQNDWTTLPEASGITTQDTGDSCPAEWNSLHPVLDRYQTVVVSGTETICNPTGTTGEWHAATGKSNGWQKWTIDLSEYAGEQVEMSISYASDFAVQGLGVFIDDVTISTGQATSFENGLDGWTVAGPPEGSRPSQNDFELASGGALPEGAVITTNDTVYMGFGLEDVDDPTDRRELLRRSILYLLNR